MSHLRLLILKPRFKPTPQSRPWAIVLLLAGWILEGMGLFASGMSLALFVVGGRWVHLGCSLVVGAGCVPFFTYLLSKEIDACWTPPRRKEGKRD